MGQVQIVRVPETERAFPVDHVRPWRSFEIREEADDPMNLVTLCHACHAWKTHTVEHKWLRGNVQPFKQFLRDVGLDEQSGWRVVHVEDGR